MFVACFIENERFLTTLSLHFWCECRVSKSHAWRPNTVHIFRYCRTLDLLHKELFKKMRENMCKVKSLRDFSKLCYSNKMKHDDNCTEACSKNKQVYSLNSSKIFHAETVLKLVSSELNRKICSLFYSLYLCFCFFFTYYHEYNLCN